MAISTTDTTLLFKTAFPSTTYDVIKKISYAYVHYSFCYQATKYSDNICMKVLHLMPPYCQNYIQNQQTLMSTPECDHQNSLLTKVQLQQKH